MLNLTIPYPNHRSAGLLQPSKPPATNTRRSSKAATAQPERPTAMVGPEENFMLVASKILGDWETHGPLKEDRLCSRFQFARPEFAVFQNFDRIAFYHDIVNSCRGKFAFCCVSCTLIFCQDTRCSNDPLYHQSHQKRWYAWKASTKDSTLVYLQRPRRWSANINLNAWDTTHWLPKINCKKTKHLILSDSLTVWH